MIMGHSLGGIIGFLFAAVYPDDVNTLISLDVVAPLFNLNSKTQLSDMGNMIDKYVSKLSQRLAPISTIDSSSKNFSLNTTLKRLAIYEAKISNFWVNFINSY